MNMFGNKKAVGIAAATVGIVIGIASKSAFDSLQLPASNGDKANVEKGTTSPQPQVVHEEVQNEGSGSQLTLNSDEQFNPVLRNHVFRLANFLSKEENKK